MNSLANLAVRPAADESQHRKPAKAIILYDHLETLLAANQLVNQMPTLAAPDYDWTIHSWRFDLLAADFRLDAYRALEEALEATLVLIAIRDPADWRIFPAEWLRLWAICRRAREARLLVVPFGRARQRIAGQPKIAELNRIAAERQLHFSVLGVPGFDGTPQTFRRPAEQNSPAGRQILVTVRKAQKPRRDLFAEASGAAQKTPGICLTVAVQPPGVHAATKLSER